MVNSTVSEVDVAVAVLICYTNKGKDQEKKMEMLYPSNLAATKVTFPGIFPGADLVYLSLHQFMVGTSHQDDLGRENRDMLDKAGVL